MYNISMCTRVCVCVCVCVWVFHVPRSDTRGRDILIGFKAGSTVPYAPAVGALPAARPLRAPIGNKSSLVLSAPLTRLAPVQYRY